MLHTLAPSEEVFQSIDQENDNRNNSTATHAPVIFDEQGVHEISELQDWPTFNNEIDQFYENPGDPEIEQELKKVIQRPNLEFKKKFVNEITSYLYFELIVSKTIEPFTANGQFICNAYLEHFHPDFTFFRTDVNNTPQNPYFPSEIKSFYALKTTETDNSNIPAFFKKQFNENCSNKDLRNARAVNQAINYILDSRLKYGILTTIKQTWVFKREEKQVYVSPVVPYQNLIRTLYWLCKKTAKEQVQLYPKPASNQLLVDSTPEEPDDLNDPEYKSNTSRGNTG